MLVWLNVHVHFSESEFVVTAQYGIASETVALHDLPHSHFDWACIKLVFLIFGFTGGFSCVRSAPANFQNQDFYWK